MKHIVVITTDAKDINSYLDGGWLIKSVTPQHVGGKGGSYNSIEGSFCFVLKKKE